VAVVPVVTTPPLVTADLVVVATADLDLTVVAQMRAQGQKIPDLAEEVQPLLTIRVAMVVLALSSFATNYHNQNKKTNK